MPTLISVSGGKIGILGAPAQNKIDSVDNCGIAEQNNVSENLRDKGSLETLNSSYRVAYQILLRVR